MSWLIRSSLDPTRFVSYSKESGWSADEQTVTELNVGGGPFGEASLSPVGPFYPSRGEGDEVALYLNAVGVLPGGLLIEEGSVLPELPAMPELPDGAEA